MKSKIFLVAVCTFFLTTSISFGYTATFIPRLSVNGEYTDNLFLTEEDASRLGPLGDMKSRRLFLLGKNNFYFLYFFHLLNLLHRPYWYLLKTVVSAQSLKHVIHYIPIPYGSKLVFPALILNNEWSQKSLRKSGNYMPNV